MSSPHGITNYKIRQSMIKKTWCSVLEGYLVKINKKLYDIFLCMNAHFFMFKPNSIFKTVGAFCAKSSSKDVTLYKKIGLKDFYEFSFKSMNKII